MNWQLLAIVLWGALGTGVVLGIVAAALPSGPAAILFGLVSTVLLITVSWLAALSIGIFTIAIPLVIAALVVTRSMSAKRRALGLGLAIVVYVLFVWIIPPIQVFSIWVIVGVCAGAYLAAAATRVRGRLRPAN